MKNVGQIIKKAKERYPATFSFRGKLSPEERKEIENSGCDIRNPSVYMDGSCYYVITYRKERTEQNDGRAEENNQKD